MGSGGCHRCCEAVKGEGQGSEKQGEARGGAGGRQTNRLRGNGNVALQNSRGHPPARPADRLWGLGTRRRVNGMEW